MIEAPKIEPGDIVRLRSGGPWMTVSHIDWHDGTVLCNWFDNELHGYSEWFLPCILQKLEFSKSHLN